MEHLNISTDCTTPTCGHHVKLYPLDDKPSYYSGVCGNCGASYEVVARRVSDVETEATEAAPKK